MLADEPALVWMIMQQAIIYINADYAYKHRYAKLLTWHRQTFYFFYFWFLAILHTMLASLCGGFVLRLGDIQINKERKA